MAIAVSAALTCSPVAASASISRAAGTFTISWARPRRRLVSPLIALTMTTTRCPARCVARARRATLRMRSIEPTEVPPNFWTTRATAIGPFRRRLARRQSRRAPFLVRGDRQTLESRRLSSYAGYLFETFVTLVAVCGLAFVVLWGARPLGLGRPSGPLEMRRHLP